MPTTPLALPVVNEDHAGVCPPTMFKKLNALTVSYNNLKERVEAIGIGNVVVVSQTIGVGVETQSVLLGAFTGGNGGTPPNSGDRLVDVTNQVEWIWNGTDFIKLASGNTGTEIGLATGNQPGLAKNYTNLSNVPVDQPGNIKFTNGVGELIGYDAIGTRIGAVEGDLGTHKTVLAGGSVVGHAKNAAQQYAGDIEFNSGVGTVIGWNGVISSLNILDANVGNKLNSRILEDYASIDTDEFDVGNEIIVAWNSETNLHPSRNDLVNLIGVDNELGIILASYICFVTELIFEGGNYTGYKARVINKASTAGNLFMVRREDVFKLDFDFYEGLIVNIPYQHIIPVNDHMQPFGVGSLLNYGDWLFFKVTQPPIFGQNLEVMVLSMQSYPKFIYSNFFSQTNPIQPLATYQYQVDVSSSYTPEQVRTGMIIHYRDCTVRLVRRLNSTTWLAMVVQVLEFAFGSMVEVNTGASPYRVVPPYSNNIYLTGIGSQIETWLQGVFTGRNLRIGEILNIWTSNNKQRIRWYGANGRVGDKLIRGGGGANGDCVRLMVINVNGGVYTFTEIPNRDASDDYTPVSKYAPNGGNNTIELGNFEFRVIANYEATNAATMKYLDFRVYDYSNDDVVDVTVNVGNLNATSKLTIRASYTAGNTASLKVITLPVYTRQTHIRLRRIDDNNADVVSIGESQTG